MKKDDLVEFCLNPNDLASIDKSQAGENQVNYGMPSSRESYCYFKVNTVNPVRPDRIYAWPTVDGYNLKGGYTVGYNGSNPVEFNAKAFCWREGFKDASAAEKQMLPYKNLAKGLIGFDKTSKPGAVRIGEIEDRENYPNYENWVIRNLVCTDTGKSLF